MSAPDVQDQLQHALGDAYVIERELGGGGMSHVFVADDTTLRRKVVVKVLRADLAEGLNAERFKREIQLVARLQHPHIVPLLSAGVLERDGGLLYYTMPFIEGESLRGRLEREGALPIADVIQLVRDVASALAYAHRQRIVHRDVKPENILLADGGAVVSDFGIAKAISAARAEDGEGDVRRSSTLTQRGTSLGTPAYMAPEQATGEVVDHRADLYSLGVVMYEMLAGRAPFEGRTPQRLIAAHAVEAPEPVGRRRPNVPPSLGSLVTCLLEKEPADRPQTADDVLRALDGMATAPMTGPVATKESAEGPAGATRGGWRPRLRDPLVLSLGLVAVVSTAALLWQSLTRPAPRIPQLRARLPLELPADAKVGIGGPGTSMALSPDGAVLVYGVRGAGLYLRRLDSLTSRPIPGTGIGDDPQFSPDGRWIAFRTPDGEIRKVPAGGGPVTTIVRDAGARFSWGAHGDIVFTRVLNRFFDGLWRVSANGGAPRQFTRPDSTLGSNYGSPTFLPDGETVVFTASSRQGELTLAAVRLHDGKIIPLGIGGGGPIYLEGGYLLFSRSDGSVNAVSFDPKSLRVVGDPVQVLDSVAVKLGNVAELAVSPNGTLVYLRGSLGRQLVELDRRGSARIVTQTLATYSGLRVSGDGRHIALGIGQPSFNSDVWVFDRASATLTRLSSGGTNAVPEWAPDGRRVAWVSDARGQDGVWWRPWDQSAPAELLVPHGRGVIFSPRGDFLLTNFDVPTGYELRMVRLPYDPKQETRPILQTTALRPVSLSHDGQWLAYVSDETGVTEVYVQRFPGPGPRLRISTAGGTAPRWSPSGKELFYNVPGCCLMSATLAFAPALALLKRDTLFSTRGFRGGYDVTPDGNHFVTASDVGTLSPPILVFGWADEVREKVAAANRR